MTDTNRVIRTINPATGEQLAEYPSFSAAQIEETIAAVSAAGEEWAAASVEQRAELLGATGRLLRERREELAQLITTEMGKPIAEALAEVDKCAWKCDYYADHGRGLPGRRSDDRHHGAASYVAYEPLGVVWPSCRGTSRSGRSSASPRPRSWPATPPCSSTPRTSAAARWPSSRSSPTPGCPTGLSLRSSLVPTVAGGSRRSSPTRASPPSPSPAASRAGASVGARGGPGAQEERPRARRLRPVRRPRRRRRRRRGRARRASPLHERRPEPASPPSASSSTQDALPTSSSACSWPRSARCTVGDPTGRGHRGRPAGPRGPARRPRAPGRASRSPPGATVLCGGERARRARAASTRPPSSPASPRHAGLPRGDLRPGRRRDPRAPTTTRRCAGQRHQLRPRRQRLDRATWTTPWRSARRIESGAVFVNAHRRLRPARALRRHQAQRLRPRAGSARRPRVHQRAQRLDRPHGVDTRAGHRDGVIPFERQRGGSGTPDPPRCRSSTGSAGDRAHSGRRREGLGGAPGDRRRVGVPDLLVEDLHLDVAGVARGRDQRG